MKQFSLLEIHRIIYNQGIIIELFIELDEARRVSTLHIAMSMLFVTGK